MWAVALCIKQDNGITYTAKLPVYREVYPSNINKERGKENNYSKCQD